jgi:POT family proton-dependent oligopeptide transporter
MNSSSSSPVETKQPKQIYMLFATEMWERFGFYGMRALLILFMTKVLSYNDENAYGIYAAFAALIYFSPFIGGIIADRLLGFKRCVIVGGILMALGYFLMTLTTKESMFAALAFIVVGNGLFKPSVSSIVGGLYEKNDPRKDAGYTIFYIGINLGAAAAPLICPPLQENLGWSYGFLAASIGMLVGMGIFTYNMKSFGTNGDPLNPSKLKEKLLGFLTYEWATYIGVFLSVPIIIASLYFYDITTYILVPVGLACFGYILLIALKSEKEEKERLFVVLILITFSIFFFALFDQAPSSLTLFADRNIDREVFGYVIPAGTLVSLNPLWVLALGSLFSWMWVELNKRGLEPSTPMKFCFALVFVGIGYGVLVLGAKMMHNNGLVPLIFLILLYLFHTIGELCLSPIGLSMITKLSPKSIVAMVMGSWFLSWSFANIVGGEIAKRTKVEQGLPPIETLDAYTNVYGILAIAAIITGIALIALVPILRKWMHGIH